VSQPTAAPAHDHSASGVPSPTDVLQPAIRRVEGTGDVLVEIIADTSAIGEHAVVAVGGTVLRSVGGLTLARMSPAQSARLAVEPGVQTVRPPVDVRAYRTGQGTVSTKQPGALSLWHQNGHDGTGTKVGILDIFDATVLASQIAAGELDPIPANQRFCFGYGQVCPFGTPGYEHGNAVAEVLADHAPGAQLYLAEVGTTTDYLAAIDWFAANGVTVVNHSGSAAFDGPGNGTGPAAAVVDYAVSKGMLWTNSAGNAANTDTYPSYSGGYWRQPWSDADGDRWMNFWGTDESMGSYCGSLFGVRWSDWGASRTDYDLYISDLSISTGDSGFPKRVLASAYNQAAGAAPIEGNALPWLCNTNPANGPVFDKNGDGFVNLWLYRSTRTSASPAGDIIEVAVNGGWLERAVDGYSAALPFADTKNPGALTVGSYDGRYSSQGPTNDGRLKPDIAATGCHSTMVWGLVDASHPCDETGFEGTSAAAPAVAGTAAAMRPAIGATNPVALARYLTSTAIGHNIPNNFLGAGQLFITSPLPTAIPSIYHPLAEPRRVLDTRPATLVGVPTAGVRPPDSLVRLFREQFGISANHTSLVISVTVVEASRPGYVQVFPWGHAAIGASSNINADAAGVTRANLVIMPSTESFGIYTQGGGHLIADVIGYFAEVPPTNVSGSRFADLEPMRVFDSRSCDACSGSPLSAMSYTDVRVAGLWSDTDPDNGVPDPHRVRSVMVSVTVQSTSGTGGYMSVVPSLTTGNPKTSNLNFSAGQTLTSTAIVRVDAATGANVKIFVSQLSHITVDVLGYFHYADPADPRGKFVGTVPYRMIDTRQSTVPPVSSGTVTSVNVGNRGGIPATGVRAVFTNLTSVRATAVGPVQASGTSATPSGNHTSLTVVGTGTAIAATTVTRVAAGSFVMRNATPTHLIADVAGYFTEGFAPHTGPSPVPIVVPTVDGLPINADVRGDLDVSADGRFIAFNSLATNLVAGPLPAFGNLYVLDRQTNSVERVPIMAASGSALGLTISDDGNVLGFAHSGQLVLPDINSGTDVYSYNRTTGVFTRINVTNSGMQAVNSVGTQYFSMSGDGTRFSVITRDKLTADDTDNLDDAFYRDVTSGTTTRLTNGDAYWSGITKDGSTVWSSNSASTATTYRFDVATGTTTPFVGVRLPGWVSPAGDQVLVGPGFPPANRVGELDPTTASITPIGPVLLGWSVLRGAIADGSVAVVSTTIDEIGNLFAVNLETGTSLSITGTYNGLMVGSTPLISVAATAEIVVFASGVSMLPGPDHPGELYMYDLSQV